MACVRPWWRVRKAFSEWRRRWLAVGLSGSAAGSAQGVLSRKRMLILRWTRPHTTGMEPPIGSTRIRCGGQFIKW
jgi:hypothetical protein